MSDVFISYVEEDSSLAVELAQGLKQSGYSTWYYGEDSIPGGDYLLQTREAIEACRAVMLVISENSLSKAKQVKLEVVRTLECGKAFLPVLVNITWAEFQKRQPSWGQAIGGTVGISVPPQGIPAILPRLAAGLKALGILPQENETASQITRTYPLPLAAAYAQKMGRPADPQQALQAHTNLRDMAEALVKTLSALVISFYRQESIIHGKEDKVVEDELQTLKQPRLEAWVALLHTTLSLYAEPPHPLLAKIYALFYDKKHRNDPISKAAVALSNWLNLSSARKPPVSYQDFFELLAQYRNHEEGWSASGAIKSPQEYQLRVEILHAALEFCLAELSFLTEYRLVNIQKSGPTAGSYRIFEATGRDLVPKTEELRSAKPLEAGHTYLSQKDAAGWLPFLDLFPLVVVQECKGCKQHSLFFLNQGRDNRQEYTSPACGHRLDSGEAFLPNSDFSLSTYLSLSHWRRLAETPAQSNTAPYLTALREVLENGEIDAQEREKLNFLAKMLHLPEEVVTRLEAQVKDELAPTATDTPTPTATETPTPTATETTPPPQIIEQRLVRCWQRTTPDPVPFLTIYGNPLFLLYGDDTGNVQVLSEDQQLVYEDRVEGRPYQLAALEDCALLTTWKGSVYCFGQQELLWQSTLGSPLSALAVSSGKVAAVVGGWDGQITAFEKNGNILWKARLEDGISTLALSDNGEFTAAGTYAGQLSVFGKTGEKCWLQDLRSPVSRIAFTRHAQDLIIARRDRVLMRLNVENQNLVWDVSLDKSPLDFALSANDRRLILASREGELLFYTIDGNPNLHAHYTLPQMSRMLVSPLSSDGTLVLALIPQGVALADNRTKTQSVEIQQPALNLALSADGRNLALGSADSVSLYRLGRPQLNAQLEPLGKLSKGRFTRLRITLQNTGERMARNIEVSLEGPLDCKPAGLPEELKAGESAASDKQSLQPLADGSLPVYIHLKYSDDFGLHHQRTDRLVLESTGSEPAN